ncbi:6-phosphogluconolactonase [Paenibacillus taihuensis]|uniref:6-phosphogluconolactonase n=1 Tax=Paenibacillus taihuensis TaxID=1156355 RepID=A0A3D9R018_9BACL|nr:lactonase family protein [Paenibacillus taihuensis]REE66494.1 6-phosphogluconolactonase [Paenibacillus taihuensis]
MAQQLFFVGSYTSAEQEGISAMLLDTETGAISRLSGLAGVLNPSFLRVNKAGTHLYVVSETGAEPGSVLSYALTGDTGGLTSINDASTLGGSPCHVELHPSERLLVATNYTGGNFCLYAIGEDGSVELADHIVHSGRGPRDDRQEAPHPHSATVDPAGRYVLVADLGTDEVVSYRIDQEAKKLVKQGATAAAPGAGPRHMAFHPQQPILYVINELDCTVAVYSYEAEQSQLTLKQVISTLTESFTDATTCADIHVTADGRFLYASNRGHDSIAVYRVDAGGTLELVQFAPSGGQTPRNFAISPDGEYLVAANQESSNIVTYRIDQATGELQPTGYSIETNKPVCIAFVK